MPDEEQQEQDIMQMIQPELFEETSVDENFSDELIHLVHNTYSETEDYHIMYADLFCDNEENFYLKQQGKEKENSRLMTYWYKCNNNEAMSKLCDEFGL